MARISPQYREFNDLMREALTWTPDNHGLYRLREIYSEMKAPSSQRQMELRLVENRLRSLGWEDPALAEETH